jgi:hypothetical protein
MALNDIKEYLVGEAIMGFTSERKVINLQKGEEEKVKNLSNKERSLRFNGFAVIDQRGNIVFEDRKRYSQHFFPLSVVDYAKALYNFERHNQQIPILSVDSHDVLGCDFRCQDCLSAYGTNFPVKKFPKDNFNMNLETYKKILKSIVDYSKKRGFIGVRFEQSGEGNPDFYNSRQQILKYAKEIQMQSVYVSTGSKIDDGLMKGLVENSSFIRISFPGIGESYQHYSGQKEFTYNDSINNLRRIVKEREIAKKTSELIIGARVALRNDHGDSYFNFADILKNIGLDSIQIVKILVPEGKKPSDFILSNSNRNDLEETATLDDAKFNVSVPHNLDSMVYSREIENRKEFPN